MYNIEQTQFSSWPIVPSC